MEPESKVPEARVDLLEKAKDSRPPPSHHEEHLPEQTNHLSEPAGEKCKPQYKTGASTSLSANSAPPPKFFLAETVLLSLARKKQQRFNFEKVISVC